MSGVMEMASELLTKVGKPAYVEFSTIAKHMPKRSEEAGRYVSVDVDMVTVRQIGAADSTIFEAERWLKQNKIDAGAQRLPAAHAEYYEKAYRHWKNGQELPIAGTPIRGWALIPPSQQEVIVRAGIRTVEDLAQMNGEAMQRIGMGAVTMKNMAQAWIEQAEDKGPLSMKQAALQRDNDLLWLQVQKLTEQLAALQAEKPKRQAAKHVEESEGGISLSDITDEEPPTTSKKRVR